jgi:hypothetical protein
MGGRLHVPVAFPPWKNPSTGWPAELMWTFRSLASYYVSDFFWTRSDVPDLYGLFVREKYSVIKIKEIQAVCSDCVICLWPAVSACCHLQTHSLHLRLALFWVITQRRMVMLTIRRCVMSQKSASLINIAAEAWNHIRCFYFEEVLEFNVFHVRALYYTKTLITSKCTKRVLSPIVTHSYMFRPCWVIFRENFLLSLH